MSCAATAMGFLSFDAKNIPTLICCCFVLLSACLAEDEWSYGDGVALWPTLQLDSVNQCGGKYQSPINIVPGNAIYNPSIGPLSYSGYLTRLRNVTVLNNGHTVMVTPADTRNVLFSGPYFPDTYRFVQFHFHWGSNSAVGSEHLFDGQQFSLEVHLVHVNMKYGTQEEAAKHQDGFAVIAGLFQVGPSDNPGLVDVVKALRKMTQEHSTQVQLESVAELRALLPQNGYYFYGYDGSLTTPPCSEAVIWTVFADLSQVSEQQLQAFRDLQMEVEGGTEPLVNNFRPVMPLNGRNVFRNFYLTWG